jgi:hypothetical protein
MSPHVSCHVLSMFWACSSHVRATQQLIHDAFFSIFFIFFRLKSIFFLESWLTPAMLGHFTLILLLNFHMLARKGHQTGSLHEILTHL